MQARLVLLLVLAMAVPSVSRAQMTSEPGVILEATPIRIDPTATVPLATLPRGMDVTVLAIQDGWLQVAFEDLRYGRRVGYVPRSTVSFSLPTPPSAARVDTPITAPQATAVQGAPAPVKPADKRAAATAAAKPATTAAARRPAVSTPAATARPEAAAPHAAPAPAPATVAATPASRPAPTAVAKPAARPPVQLVEADFPDLVTPKKAANKPATSAAGATAAAATPATAVKPAPRPPVRLVEAEFPDLVTPPKKPAPKAAARSVVSIGDAFPDAAGTSASTAAAGSGRSVTASALPAATSQSPAQATAARPAVRLVHAEFPAIAPAAVNTDEPKPAPRSVVSIGNAFPALADSAPAAAHDVQLVDGHAYVSFDLGVDASVFDDRSADVESIVARVLKQTVLPRVRQVARALPPVPDARGIRVLYRIPHPAAASKEYRLELVADMPHVVAFAVAGTTDEAFVNGSTLRVDGNGIRVDLTRIAD